MMTDFISFAVLIEPTVQAIEISKENVLGVKTTQEMRCNLNNLISISTEQISFLFNR
jgi:hypothetical protein